MEHMHMHLELLRIEMYQFTNLGAAAYLRKYVIFFR